ncbi:MAG TPA: rRNA maturation RNase YbeY [Candidatus Paceibacterota bacterium]|nr:rRNA maturation RNase YbeY [Candidatus Paceibacterota bacterium]
MSELLSVKKTIRGSVPRIPFEAIAREILGAHYELSLVICGDTLAQRMNAEYRKKTYRPNVLSFPIDTKEGEIFLNVPCAHREAKKYGTTLEKRLALLFVHGCFHLKGLDHQNEKDTKKMEAQEQKILTRFHFA